MKTRIRLALAAASLLPATAFADLIPSAAADAYYVAKSDLKVGGADSDGGKGYGVRGRVSLPLVFVKGEYQHDTYDGFGGAPADTKLDQFRLGAGTHLGPTPLYGMAEYIRDKVDVAGSSTSNNGFGAHVGIEGTPTPIVSLYGQIGYVKVGHSGLGSGKGPEYNAGAVFSVAPLVGLFADYRHTDVKDDNGVKSTLSDWRLGVRVGFGS